MLIRSALEDDDARTGRQSEPEDDDARIGRPSELEDGARIGCQQRSELEEEGA